MEDHPCRFEIGSRLIETARGDQHLGAIGEAQATKHAVATQIGEPRGDVELGEGLGELAVLGQMRAVVAPDAHELEEILRSLGVVESAGVVAVVGDVVAVDASDHRQHRVRRGQGLVVALP